MNLREILKALDLDSEDLPSTSISSLAIDSRKVEPGGAFFALRGEHTDGKTYIDEALKNGAILILEEAATKTLSFEDNICKVSAPRSSLTPLVKLSLPFELNELLSIAITGTNGKTTIGWLLTEALTTLEESVVQAGTCGIQIFDKTPLIPSPTTTPNIVELAEFLTDKTSPTALVAEMSSHALVQQRLSGLAWDAAIFTNLSRDHLDYHPSFDEYRQAKELLFSRELATSSKSPRFAIVNIDDPSAETFANTVRSYKDIFPVRFSTESSNADCFLTEIQSSISGIEARASLFGEQVEFSSSLVGTFNASNILAALACLSSLGFVPREAAAALSEAKGPPGRLEKLSAAGVTAIVDYAHTPDALMRVSSTLKKLAPSNLIVVFGCGGDRDRGKRAEMAKSVSSDFAFVTSDNPRTENPMEIIEDILPGMEGNYEVIADRKAAIEAAITKAKEGDVVLVAGKGHEDYQEIMGVKHPFSDREICEQALKNKL